MSDAPIIVEGKSNNPLLWFLGFVGLGALGLYYWKNIPKKVSVHGIQNASQAQLQALAHSIHEEIDGLTIISHTEYFKQALALSDGDFIRLYNIYNELYQQMEGETMRESVADEFAWLGNYSFAVVQDEFLSRCAALNLP